MAKQDTYLLRGGLATLGLLAFLVAVYITLGWLIVSMEADTMQEAQARFNAMFPAFLRVYAVRQVLAFFASAFAFTLSVMRHNHLTGIKRAIAMLIMIASPFMALLNLFWLM